MQVQVHLRSRKSLDITEVARHTGVPASTLRFYEEKCPAPSHMECPTFRRILESKMCRATNAKRKRTEAF